jgi:hypothetical protein
MRCCCSENVLYFEVIRLHFVVISITVNEQNRILKTVLYLCIFCESGDTVFAMVRRNKISQLSVVSTVTVSCFHSN